MLGVVAHTETPILGREREEDHKFKCSQVSVVRPRGTPPKCGAIGWNNVTTVPRSPVITVKQGM